MTETVRTPFWDILSSSDATTSTAVYTPPTGKRFHLTDLSVSTGTAGTITVYDETDTIAIFYLAANKGDVLNLKTPIKSAKVDNVLKIKHSASGNISVTVAGYSE